MPAESLLLLGAGGHARVCAEAIAAAGHTLRGHVGPEPGEGVGPYLGPDAVVPEEIADGAKLVIGLGSVNHASIARRGALLASLPPEALMVLCHPGAHVAPSARLEPGVFVAVGAIVGTGSRLGRGAIVNSGAIVDHDCQIGANTHIATGARLSGGITVGANCLIGVGASLRQGVQVGEGAIVAAGAVVVSDVAPGAIVMGVPAQ